jgi:hypothetical protein
LGSLAAVLAMPLDKASSMSPIFSARGFEDGVLLVAMELLFDTYVQWFHIGSYQLATRFSQRGGWVHLTGKAFTCSDVSDFQSKVMCRGTSLGHGKSVCGEI